MMNEIVVPPHYGIYTAMERNNVLTHERTWMIQWGKSNTKHYILYNAIHMNFEKIYNDIEKINGCFGPGVGGGNQRVEGKNQCDNIFYI